MNPSPKKRSPQKAKSRKKSRTEKFIRLLPSILLLLLLAFSLFAAGYVIFFRTVVAGEIPLEMVSNMPSDTSRSNEDSSQQERRMHSVHHPLSATQRNLPKVAIIIDDMGYDEAIGKELLNFPIELTYSFLPFAPHTRKLERLAHRAGKTVFLHLPLEPKDSTFNPGPGALYLSDSPETQKEKLAKCLQEVPHAVGINNHMGSAFTEDRLAMANIMEVIKGRSLMFVDSYTTPRTVGLQTARQVMVESFGRSVFLDNEVDEEKICRQLEKLVLHAEKNGRAIGIGHPHRETMSAVNRCGDLYLNRVWYVGIREGCLSGKHK